MSLVYNEFNDAGGRYMYMYCFSTGMHKYVLEAINFLFQYCFEFTETMKHLWSRTINTWGRIGKIFAWTCIYNHVEHHLNMLIWHVFQCIHGNTAKFWKKKHLLSKVAKPGFEFPCPSRTIIYNRITGSKVFSSESKK